MEDEITFRQNQYITTIMDFDPREGDSLLVGKDEFNLPPKARLKTVKNDRGKKKKDKKAGITWGYSEKMYKAFTSDKEFIYDQRRGKLYFNSNGIEEGWGEGYGDGGLIAMLSGSPNLRASNIVVL